LCLCVWCMLGVLCSVIFVCSLVDAVMAGNNAPLFKLPHQSGQLGGLLRPEYVYNHGVRRVDTLTTTDQQ
jgi:hypothetical protein